MKIDWLPLILAALLLPAASVTAQTSPGRLSNGQFFDPNRSAANPVANEFRSRNSHLAVTFSVRRGFGGGGAKAG